MASVFESSIVVQWTMYIYRLLFASIVFNGLVVLPARDEDKERTDRYYVSWNVQLYYGCFRRNTVG